MLEGFNFRIIWEYLPLYGQCFLATLWLSGLSLLGAIMVGIISCAMRLSQLRILRGIAGVYIETIRSTPLLAQLYFFYFGLPSMGIMLPEWVTGVIALTLNSGAYYAEIIRAGIKAIDFGQIEAGIASGLSYFQRMRYIILPQALGNTIRPMLGQAIILVKDSSLLSLISIMELTDHSGFLSDYLLHAQGFLGLV
jgi:polar amino acid transport system permease protein